jgi:ABC-2 type transport system permease protein
MRLLGSELLKIRTAPRTVIGLVLAELVVVAIGTASTIDSATSTGAPPGVEVETPALRNLESDLIGAVSSSLLFALILGVLVITWEYRHGTITQTFLVTPVRERVIGVKMLAAGLIGAILVIPALVLMLVIAEIWVGDKVHFGGHELQLMGRVFLGAAIVGVLGLEIGAGIGRQLGAVVVAFAWAAFVEPALSIWDTIQPYLPLHTIFEGVLGSGEGSLSFGRGLLTIAIYVAGLGAVALGLTRRRDIT